ncbi:MAG: ABC transporter ATP-binding protein [Pseudomonadota bacterium]
MIKTVLALDGVRKNFGKLEILCGVTLQIPEKERWAIIGPNGAGKSLLLNSISGFSDISAGTIHLHGKKIDGMRPCDIYRRGLSRSFQTTNIFPKLTVYENLQCAVLWALGHRHCFWRRLTALKDVRLRAESMLEQIGLCNRRAVPAGLLTYAEQRALELGITIAGGADVILLDEPTAGMNRHEADTAVALIRSMTIGKTLLMVEHDMQVIFSLADRVAVLAQGTIIACDTPVNVRNNPLVQNSYLGNDAGRWQ